MALRGVWNRELGRIVWEEIPDLDVPPTNSGGNTDSDVRKFCRRAGVPTTKENVDRIGKELRRTRAQNEKVERLHKEMQRERGIPATVNERGEDVKAKVKAAMKKRLNDPTKGSVPR